MKISDQIVMCLQNLFRRKVRTLLTVSGSRRQLVIRFENEILLQSKNPESTEVGVRNICLMMEKMHGLCQVRKTKGRYCIQLAFAAERE